MSISVELVSPAPELRQYVQSFWFASGQLAQAHNELHYLSADAGCGISFNLADTIQLDGVFCTQPYFINGPVVVTQTLGLESHIDLVGVRFRPMMGHLFFAEPLSEYHQQINASTAVLNHLRLDEISQRLYDCNGTEQRAGLLNCWLTSYLSNLSAINPYVSNALPLLRQVAGCGGSIDKISQNLHISQRQLERLFNCWLGMSPKRYRQIMRVDQLKTVLKKYNTVELSQVAVSAGYADQSHFNREFKTVTGITPGQYRRLVNRI